MLILYDGVFLVALICQFTHQSFPRAHIHLYLVVPEVEAGDGHGGVEWHLLEIVLGDVVLQGVLVHRVHGALFSLGLLLRVGVSCVAPTLNLHAEVAVRWGAVGWVSSGFGTIEVGSIEVGRNEVGEQ